MPKRPEKNVPRPRKSRNSLVTYVDGMRISFGKWGDPVALQKFADFYRQRALSENETPTPVSSGGTPPNSGVVPPAHGTPLVADLVAAFLDFAKERKHPKDYPNYRLACKALLRYADLPTAEFDAFLIHEIQDGFVKAGYARKYCNKLLNLCLCVFKWGETRRLSPPGKKAQLRAVDPLRYGEAREGEERTTVSSEVVETTLPYLLPVYRAIVKILRETGARPSEILRMKVGDIERKSVKSEGMKYENDPPNNEIWVYKPRKHKTQHKNKRRIIVFGTKEQDIIAPYLRNKSSDSAIFSPKDAIIERRKRDRENRKSPVPPSQVARAMRQKLNPKAKVNEHLEVAAVGRYLRAAIKRANRELPPDQQIPNWTLYQLRHSFATEVMIRDGEETAIMLMGHTDAKMLRDFYDHSQEQRIIEYKKRQDESDNGGTSSAQTA